MQQTGSWHVEGNVLPSWARCIEAFLLIERSFMSMAGIVMEERLLTSATH